MINPSNTRIVGGIEVHGVPIYDATRITPHNMVFPELSIHEHALVCKLTKRIWEDYIGIQFANIRTVNRRVKELMTAPHSTLSLEHARNIVATRLHYLDWSHVEQMTYSDTRKLEVNFMDPR